jgi:hypothetical protein
MKIADIVTDTVVYAVAERGGSFRYRAVVLDTARWEAVRKSPNNYRPGNIVTYRPAPATYPGQRATYSERSGMLALQVRYVQMTDADLLDLAARAAVTIREGGLPELPSDVQLRLLRPQDVDTTWAEYERRRNAQVEQAKRENAVRARGAAEQAAAQSRLHDVLGDRCPSYLPAGMSWVELEKLCQAFAMAQGIASLR